MQKRKVKDKRREFEREEGKEAFLLKPDPEMAGQEQPDSP